MKQSIVKRFCSSWEITSKILRTISMRNIIHIRLKLNKNSQAKKTASLIFNQEQKISRMVINHHAVNLYPNEYAMFREAKSTWMNVSSLAKWHHRQGDVKNFLKKRQEQTIDDRFVCVWTSFSAAIPIPPLRPNFKLIIFILTLSVLPSHFFKCNEQHFASVHRKIYFFSSEFSK